MTQKLKNKTIVIAGAASGAGLELAKTAVAAGANVHLLGRSAAKLEKAASQLNGKFSTHVVDISVEEGVERFASQIGAIDHLVTTAADLTFKPFIDLNNEEIARILGTKLYGPMYLVRHLSSKFADGGSVTFVSGSAAYKATAGGSVVAAGNAALDGLSRTLAIELPKIRFNVVSPGVFDGGTWNFLEGDVRSKVLDDIGRGLPRGKVGTSADVASAIIFFMTNDFATGTVLQLDGGANA